MRLEFCNDTSIMAVGTSDERAHQPQHSKWAKIPNRVFAGN